MMHIRDDFTVHTTTKTPPALHLPCPPETIIHNTLHLFPNDNRQEYQQPKKEYFATNRLVRAAFRSNDTKKPKDMNTVLMMIMTMTHLRKRNTPIPRAPKSTPPAHHSSTPTHAQQHRHVRLFVSAQTDTRYAIGVMHRRRIESCFTFRVFFSGLKRERQTQQTTGTRN